MGMLLKSASVKPSTATRTLAYTCPASTTTTIFDGTISNVDTTNKAVQYATIEHEKAGVFTTIGNEMPIPYGRSPRFPKMVLNAGEKLHVTIKTANMVHVFISLVEKT